jgi:hypothetical protein
MSMTKPMTKERALSYVEDMVDMALAQNFKDVRYIQMRELREIKALLLDIKKDSAQFANMKTELERMKRNMGQLGSHDPD